MNIKSLFCGLLASMFLLWHTNIKAQVEVSPFLTQPIFPNTTYPHIQKSVSMPAALTFAQAVASCRNLIWNGDSNWYLPTAAELILFSNAADEQNPLVSCVTVTDPLTLFVNGVDFYAGRGDTAAGSYMCQAYYKKFGSMTRSVVDGSGAHMAYSIGGAGQTIAESATAPTTTAPTNVMVTLNPHLSSSTLVSPIRNYFTDILYPFRYGGVDVDSLSAGATGTQGTYPTIHGDFYMYDPMQFKKRVALAKGRNITYVKEMGVTFAGLRGWNLRINGMINTLTTSSIWFNTFRTAGGTIDDDTTYAVLGSMNSAIGGNIADNLWSSGHQNTVGIRGGHPVAATIIGISPVTLSPNDPDFNFTNPAFISANVSNNKYVNFEKAISYHYQFAINHVIVVGTALSKEDFQTTKASSLIGMANFMLHTPSSSQKNGVHCVRNYGN